MRIIVSMMLGLLINVILISIYVENEFEFFVEYLPMMLASVLAIYALNIKATIIKTEPHFSAVLNSYDGIEVVIRKMEAAGSKKVHLAKKIWRISYVCHLLIGWCMAFSIIIFVKFVFLNRK
jgi:hypothetical protein